MRLISLVTLSFAVLLTGATLARAETQEAFLCTLKEGKTLEDLMKVSAQFAAEAVKLPGGKDYEARILVPIASQNMQSVIWIGSMPTFSAMASFSDAYQASEAGKKLDKGFQGVVDCQSHSYWQVMDVM